ncbi:MAG: DivIVA domain-containing protein [Coriobacteriia bacterium]|nr:DivIVA domain-containing protein [Coriobacteriia bacterium]
MKLTPLDIHHKEFRHSLRGYSEEEVDAFLDEVADEFERLFKENIDLSEKLEAAREQVRQYQEQEHTIRNTMIAAQRSADDIVSKATGESASVLRDAELKAKEIIHNALQQKQKVAAELIRIKQSEEDFRARFRGLLDQHARDLSEIKVPEDVTVLMGETEEGMVGEVEVASRAAADAVARAADEGTAAVVDVAASFEPPSAEVAMPEAIVELGEEFEAEVELPTEPPESGFVESVQLGEVESPDLGPDDPSLEEPKEFELKSFDDLGEREDDIDIEEID